MIISRRTLQFQLSVLVGLAMALAGFDLAAPQPLWAATSNKLPLHFIRSADCTGELVEITGTIHFVTHTQVDGSVVGHFNYQGVTGVGLTSGITYKTSAVDHLRLSAPFPSSINSTRSFHLISKGAASNLLVSVIYHITVNASGEVTVLIDELNVHCT